jgi:hypothetical protein
VQQEIVMRKVNYVVHCNACDEKITNGNLVNFILNFRKLFVGNLMPPLTVLNKVLLKTSDDEVCNDISWEPFSITEQEYIKLTKDLTEKHNIKSHAINLSKSINNYLDWYLWAMNHAYGVPIESHRKMEMKVRDCEKRRVDAIKAGMESKIINKIDSERLVSSMELADFLGDYIKIE